MTFSLVQLMMLQVFLSNTHTAQRPHTARAMMGINNMGLASGSRVMACG